MDRLVQQPSPARAHGLIPPAEAEKAFFAKIKTLDQAA